MSARSFNVRLTQISIVLLSLLSATIPAHADNPTELLQQLNDYPHARTVDFSEAEVLDYEIGLGPVEKVGGSWRLKRSERDSGLLTRYTWQVIDGFTSIEVMNELLTQLDGNTNSELLYSCDGRSCGQGVQWANRVFKQRILYGREDLQRYRVYSLGSEEGSQESTESRQYRLVIYSSARSSERQYLHVELLQLSL